MTTGSLYRAVLKWSNAEQATDAQRQAIRQLVKDGPPTGLAGKRFVWPLDVVTAPQSRQFGDLMSVIDTQRFADLIREETTPSMETDLHSLAVRLFQLWVRHHPLHGEN